MFKRKRNILLALGLCALVVPMIVLAKDKVERPFKLHGENCLILDFSNYLNDPIIPFEIEWESGQATHLGLYTSSGTGTHNLVTGESNASGYATAANGDKVYWESTLQAGGPAIITWTGGTGRFEGASGSWTETSTVESKEWIPDTWLERITYSLSGSGTITY